MLDVNEKLREVAKVGSEVELKALLDDPGCDTWSKDRGGMTALMWAANCGQDACVRLLLPLSDARAKSDGGHTALIHAACRGSEECVRLLLPKSDVLATNVDGKTASMCAHERCHKSLAKFLEACELSQTEQASIEGAASHATPRKRAAPRV